MRFVWLAALFNGIYIAGFVTIVLLYEWPMPSRGLVVPLLTMAHYSVVAALTILALYITDRWDGK